MLYVKHWGRKLKNLSCRKRKRSKRWNASVRENKAIHITLESFCRYWTNRKKSVLACLHSAVVLHFARMVFVLRGFLEFGSLVHMVRPG